MAEENNDTKIASLEKSLIISQKIKTIACHLGVSNKLLEEGRQKEAKEMLGETAYCILDFMENYPRSLLINPYKYSYQRASALYQLKFGYRGG
ncbi:hypothetical protein J4465_02395 [Candidatus Pacearchaeota archaeon]|nr:hypothetical protein [Candidatus Pacearchaeota archaeon]